MRLITYSKSLYRLFPRHAPSKPCVSVVAGLCLLAAITSGAAAQLVDVTQGSIPDAQQRRAQRSLDGRVQGSGKSEASAITIARQQHAALQAEQASATGSALNASWLAIGPNQIASASYGQVTGRVTAIAIDSADITGNTVYLGTSGGGVWKSTNAASASNSVVFAPLTDTISVFSANAGTPVIPSLSIGAISIQPGVSNGIILAGTGDPNAATDSFYGSGLLRSADGGATWTLIQNAHDIVSTAPADHYFTGLGVAGFAWSGTSTSLVVAALSDSAEGNLVLET